MSITRERALDDLEAVEDMAQRYKEYLADYKLGGDWSVSNFMAHLAKTTERARLVLEESED